jgi:hypothetical protein
MNNQGNPMQEIIYQGNRIKFSKFQNPGNESHLRAVAENYFSTGKEVRDMVI